MEWMHTFSHGFNICSHSTYGFWFVPLLCCVIIHHICLEALEKNPVAVLATLTLLSYGKILRTIISSLFYTSLEHPDGTYHKMWLYNGEVPYFGRSDHIALGISAIGALLFLFLPYTLLMLMKRCWLFSCRQPDSKETYLADAPVLLRARVKLSRGTSQFIGSSWSKVAAC